MKKLIAVLIVIVVVGLVSRQVNPQLLYNNEVVSTETISQLREQGLAMYCAERNHDVFGLTLACYDTQVEVDIDIAQRIADAS